MSLSYQGRPARGENPFEIFDTPPRPARTNPASHRRIPRPPAPVGGHAGSVAAPPPIKKRVVRQQSRPSLKAVAGVVALLLVGFSLLPVPLQKRFYGFLRGTPASIERIDPLPVAYDYISSPFGKRWGRQHQGIDFAAPHGAPIYAMSAGTVVYSGWESGYGKSVVIDHGNGTQTRYAHCSKLLVKAGKVVSKGQKIATIGSTGHSTGPHLHFEVIVKGVRKNPAWYYAFATSAQAAVAQAKP